MVKSHTIQIHKNNPRPKLLSEENKNAEEVYLITEQIVYTKWLSGSISFIDFKENRLYFRIHKYIAIKENKNIENIDIAVWLLNDNKSIFIIFININW